MTGQTSRLHTWWADLRHGGLLISPVVLNEWLPEGPPPLDDRRYRRLRDRFTAFLAKTTGDSHGGPALHDWIDALLGLCALTTVRPPTIFLWWSTTGTWVSPMSSGAMITSTTCRGR